MEYKEKPIISVVTIVYNGLANIEKTILSIQNQKNTNIEQIVIDGGSTDGTVEVIKKYSKKIARWISEPDRGIYDAMNKGIDLATGEWIVFMNAGDVFYNDDVLSELANRSYLDNTGIVYGDVEFDFGKPGRLIKSFRKFKKDEVVTELCHQSVMTRAKVLKQIKYDTSYRIMADLNSFKQIYDMGYSFEYVPIVFSIFEVSEGISSKKPLISLNEICRIKGIGHNSLEYFKLYIKSINKYLLLKILPKEIYDKIRYKKVASIKKYQQN